MTYFFIRNFFSLKMSFLSNEQLLSPEFFSGIGLVNLQEESKIELIFLRLVEHETRIRSEPDPSSASTDAFSDDEKQKLASVLAGTGSVEQVSFLSYKIRLL